VAAVNALEIDIRRKAFARDGAHIEVVRRLQLAVKPGEFVAVLGPSGCGKSTTLQIAAGLDTDFEGSVRYGPGVNDHLAYVFQQPRLLPWRTVQQNIELVFDDPAMHRDHISDVLAAVDLTGSEDLFPGQLSLGMQRRAALARAFVLKPQLLLMDEPFVSLDATLAHRLRDVLRDMLQHNPAAVVFVTHDWREAVSLADRLVFLDTGPATVRAEVKVNIAEAQREDATVQDRFRKQHAAAFAGAANHASQ
jgi:ABC-type nitrate/sulfonate/bicarbonate transport system ATPase subunit